MQIRKNEIWVGLFILLALLSVLFICLRITNITSIRNKSTYRIYAVFDNIGGLKVRSPVCIGGVVIGRVVNISLDERTYLPRVEMNIETRYNRIPDTSSISVRTYGLLGEQYLALSVGFEDSDIGTSVLKNDDVIQNTRSAIILEDAISQFIYGIIVNSKKSNDVSM